MTETLIAWILLFLGTIHRNEQLLIASGVFAVACNVSRIAYLIKEWKG